MKVSKRRLASRLNAQTGRQAKQAKKLCEDVEEENMQMKVSIKRLASRLNAQTGRKANQTKLREDVEGENKQMNVSKKILASRLNVQTGRQAKQAKKLHEDVEGENMQMKVSKKVLASRLNAQTVRQAKQAKLREDVEGENMQMKVLIKRLPNRFNAQTGRQANQTKLREDVEGENVQPCDQNSGTPIKNRRQSIRGKSQRTSTLRKSERQQRLRSDCAVEGPLHQDHDFAKEAPVGGAAVKGSVDPEKTGLTTKHPVEPSDDEYVSPPIKRMLHSLFGDSQQQRNRMRQGRNEEPMHQDFDAEFRAIEEMYEKSNEDVDFSHFLSSLAISEDEESTEDVQEAASIPRSKTMKYSNRRNLQKAKKVKQAKRHFVDDPREGTLQMFIRKNEESEAFTKSFMSGETSLIAIYSYICRTYFPDVARKKSGDARPTGVAKQNANIARSSDDAASSKHPDKASGDEYVSTPIKRKLQSVLEDSQQQSTSRNTRLQRRLRSGGKNEEPQHKDFDVEDLASRENMYVESDEDEDEMLVESDEDEDEDSSSSTSSDDEESTKDPREAASIPRSKMSLDKDGMFNVDAEDSQIVHIPLNQLNKCYEKISVFCPNCHRDTFSEVILKPETRHRFVRTMQLICRYCKKVLNEGPTSTVTEVPVGTEMRPVHVLPLKMARAFLDSGLDYSGAKAFVTAFDHPPIPRKYFSIAKSMTITDKK